MAFTFTDVFDGTAVGLRNQVRLALGDTNAARPWLQDAEIDYYLGDHGSDVARSALAALDALEAQLSTAPDAQSSGRDSVSYSRRLDALRSLRARLERRASLSAAAIIGGTSLTRMRAHRDDEDTPPAPFEMLTDDPADDPLDPYATGGEPL